MERSVDLTGTIALCQHILMGRIDTEEGNSIPSLIFKNLFCLYFPQEKLLWYRLKK